MGCTPIPGGFVCSRGPKPRKLCVPCLRAGRKTPSTKLCDYPEGAAKVAMLPDRGLYPPSQTCDTPLCGKCAVRKGKDLDWCPEHKEGA